MIVESAFVFPVVIQDIGIECKATMAHFHIVEDLCEFLCAVIIEGITLQRYAVALGHMYPAVGKERIGVFVDNGRVACQMHPIVYNPDITDEDVPVLTDVDIVIQAIACEMNFPVRLS